MLSPQDRKDMMMLLREIDSELLEIDRLSRQMEDSYRSLTNSIRGVGNAVDEHSTVFASGLGRVGLGVFQDTRDVRIAGGMILVAGVVKGVGYGISKATESISHAIEAKGMIEAAKKRDEALAILLKKKQEVAKTKLPFVDKSRSRLERFPPIIQRALVADSASVVEPDRAERIQICQKSLRDLVDQYVQAANAIDQLDYVKREFEAWLAGKHSHRGALVAPYERRNFAFNALTETFPSFEAVEPYDVPAVIPQGALLCLRDSDQSILMVDHPRTWELYELLAQANFRARVIPFGKKRAAYLKWYEDFVVTNAEVERLVSERWRRINSRIALVAFIFTIGMVVVFVFVAGGIGRQHSDEVPRIQGNPKPTPEIASASTTSPNSSGGSAINGSWLRTVCESNSNEATCTKCPSYTAGAGKAEEVSLSVVARGSLITNGGDDLLIHMTGCETHADDFSGTVLAERTTDGYRLAAYYPGLDTSTCVVFPSGTERDVFVCHTARAGQGSIEGSVSLHKFFEADHSVVELFTYGSDALACPNDEAGIFELENLERRGNDLRVRFKAGKVQVPEEFSDFCDAIENGFAPSVRTYDLLLGFDGQKFDTSSFPDLLLISDSESPNSGDLELNSILNFAENSETAYQLHRRRLEALRSQQNRPAYMMMSSKLRERFPKHEFELLRDLVSFNEELGEYSEASKIHDKLVARFGSSKSVLSDASWFYATAPGEIRDAQRAKLLAQPLAKSSERAVLALSEVAFRDEGLEFARELLAKADVTKPSPFFTQRLREMNEGTAKPISVPAPLTIALPHKVPAEWKGSVPTGEFTDNERLFAVVYVSQSLSEAREYERAKQLVQSAIARTEEPYMTVTLALQLGSLHEAAREFSEAFALYTKLMKEAPAGDNRPEKRFAWFLATTPSASHKDLDRALILAEETVRTTNRRDPSAIDTLAEIYHQLGRDEAVGMMKECIALDPRREYYRTRLAQFAEN